MNLLFLLRPNEDYRPLLELLGDVERRHETCWRTDTAGVGPAARASAERPPFDRAEVRPGVDPELAEDMEVLADALVPDGEAS